MGKLDVHTPLTEYEVISYGLTSFSAAAMHNIFLMYYLHLFMDVYKLSDSWFYWGETMYAIWNAINDPLFGWLLESMKGETRAKARFPIIKYGGIAWGLGFLLLFFPFSYNGVDHPHLTGIHFTLSLFVYDGLLSLVMLAHASLLADMTPSMVDRARCNSAASACGALGSAFVFSSHLFWDPSDVSSFQILCIVIACIAIAGFLLSYYGLKNHSTNSSGKSSKNKSAPLKPTLAIFAKQMIQSKNFVLFVIFNFIQVFNCHFNSNFLSIFLHTLVKDHVSSFIQSSIIFLSAILPHFMVILLSPVIKSDPANGLYNLINNLLYIKIGLGVAVVLFGNYTQYYTIVLFILLNKTFSETICRHGNLVVTNIIDEDKAKYSRPVSLSAMIFGANALITKPAQSVAPILGWLLLSEKYRQRDQPENNDLSSDDLKKTIFLMLCLVPATCGVLQYWVWKIFDLRGNKLTKIMESENVKYDV